MIDQAQAITDDRQICDYPVCSTRGSGHPLACGCRSASSPPRTTNQPGLMGPILERKVVMAGRAFTRCVTEFPDDPSIWTERVDVLCDAVKALDDHLDRAFAERMS